MANFNFEEFKWFSPRHKNQMSITIPNQESLNLNPKLMEQMPQYIEIGVSGCGRYICLREKAATGYKLPKSGAVKDKMLVRHLVDTGVHLPARYTVTKEDCCWIAVLEDSKTPPVNMKKPPCKPKKREHERFYKGGRSTVNTDLEERALSLVMPHLEKMCHERWRNLEYEDRLSEVCIVFLSAFRTFSINTGNFMADFEHVLVPYMDEVNRQTPSRYFGTCSLDAAIPTKTGAEDWHGYDFQKCSEDDESKLYVNSFLDECSQAERMIVTDLCVLGLSKAEIARKNHLSIYELNRLLKQIGSSYIRGYQNVF